jgi:hypothetical protein
MRIDFKGYFVEPLQGPISSNSIKEGAVRVDPEVFAAKPNGLRIDTKGKNVVVVNFVLSAKELAEFKGSSVVFRFKAKWLHGTSEVGVNMRCFGKGKYLFGSRTTLSPKADEWQTGELACVIPDHDDVDRVDFHTGVSGLDETVVVLDECSLELSERTANTATPTFFAMAQPGAASLDIVRDGKAVVTVVLPENPSNTEVFAAEELCEHIEKSSGVRLEVIREKANEKTPDPAIHIGGTFLANRFGISPKTLSPDSWIVRRTGNTLFLSGGDNTTNAHPLKSRMLAYGTLYATYEFLERVLGVRWYWPGELGRVVPPHPAIAIGNINWSGAPTYETRTAAFNYHHKNDYTGEESARWSRRLRMGGIGGSPIGNHSFTHWDKKYGAEHPEWFALQRNGTRQIDPDHKSYQGHLCLTNPEVVAQIITEKREFFDKNPDVLFSAVMPGDGMETYYCRCQNCMAQVVTGNATSKTVGNGKGSGSHSLQVWGLVNKVAEEIQKSHPGRFISCDSYSIYATLPADFTLRPNVAVTICDGSFPSYMWNPGVKENYASRVAEWEQRNGRLYVWDYWLPRWTAQNTSLGGAPAVFPHALKEWWGLDRGRVRGHFIEFTQFDAEGNDIKAWANWMLDSLNYYVATRLLWNFDQDVDSILEEFYREFYGPAAPQMKQFYERLEQAFLDPSTKTGAWDWQVCWLYTYPPEFVEEVMACLREAVKVTEGVEPYASRTKKTLEGYLVFEAGSQRFAKALKREVKNVEIVPPTADAEPAIDGELNEACWQNAAKADGFVHYFNMPGLLAATEIRFLSTAQNLYVAIQAELPKGNVHIMFKPGSRDDALWAQESVELFFVQEDKKYQILVGPDDVYADNFHPNLKLPFSMDMFKWNCKDVKFKTARDQKGWRAELAIPLSSLELAVPTRNQPWQVNFCRTYFYTDDMGYTKKELSTWRPTFGSFHNAERYGRLYVERK